MRINKDGSIYDENGNYYGEHIKFSSITMINDNRILTCEVDSSESSERIKDLLDDRVEVNEENPLYISFNESLYDINKLNKFIIFFDSCIGRISLLECCK